jgi:hypothetical protein
MQAQGASGLGKTITPWRYLRGQECPRHTIKHGQAENEVPQPHDLVAWGFTNTNPCCIRVS